MACNLNFCERVASATCVSMNAGGWIRVKRSQPVVVDEPVNGRGECTLSFEQLAVLDYVLSRHESVFLTGPAGSGKSAVLRKLYMEIAPPAVALTASSGVAASLLTDGMTIHSWSGLDTTLSIRYALNNRLACERWRATQVLVIDEISMVSKELFECLDQLGRQARGTPDLPFGGLTVLLVGDFLQLGPVHESGYCFTSSVWKQLVQHVVQLTYVYRQSGALTVALNELRIGHCSAETFALLQPRFCLPPATGAPPIYLEALRADADQINADFLMRLSAGRGSAFQSAEFGDAALLHDCPAIPLLKLKQGARVMLVSNIRPPLLVNGSLGTVVSFDVYPYVQFDIMAEPMKITPVLWTVFDQDNETPLASRQQVPLILAWGITIHRAQGLSLACAIVSLKSVFKFGHAYVALSRVKSLDGLFLREVFDPAKIKADPAVLVFYGIKPPAPEQEILAAPKTRELLQLCGHSLRGYAFIITGELDHFTRSQGQEFIRNHGGRVVVTLAKALTDALVGSKAGPVKTQHFVDNRIRQWSEDELIAHVCKKL